MGEQAEKVAAELEVQDAKFKTIFGGVLERTARHLVQLDWYDQQRDRMIGAATDPQRAGNLWDAHAGDYEPGSMRLRMMQRLLCAQGLLSAEAGRMIRTEYPDEAQLEAAAEAEAELDRMIEARDKMLASASDQHEARQLYNSECWGPLSWAKLVDLAEKLEGRGLIEKIGREDNGTENAKARRK